MVYSRVDVTRTHCTAESPLLRPRVGIHVRSEGTIDCYLRNHGHPDLRLCWRPQSAILQCSLEGVLCRISGDEQRGRSRVQPPGSLRYHRATAIWRSRKGLYEAARRKRESVIRRVDLHLGLRDRRLTSIDHRPAACSFNDVHFHVWHHHCSSTVSKVIRPHQGRLRGRIFTPEKAFLEMAAQALRSIRPVDWIVGLRAYHRSYANDEVEHGTFID